MIHYCPQCGKRINDQDAKFCSSCGAPLKDQSFNERINYSINQSSESIPSSAETIISLNKVAEVLCIIFGIFFLIAGFVTLIVFVGIFFLAFAFVNFFIKSKLSEINSLIKQRQYKKAKDEQLIWMIIGFLLGGIIVGIILLIGYIKYDDLI